MPYLQQLVALLAHAGDTLASLVPGDGSSVPEADTDVFEEKAQQWFVTLNEVQTVLKTAIFQLRQANAMPLTANLSSEARASGFLGAADEAPVDLALLRHALTTAPAPLSNGATATSPPDADLTRLISPEDAVLSLNALRLEAQTWTDLAAALRDVIHLTSSGGDASDQPFSELAHAEADRRLIDALIAQK